MRKQFIDLLIHSTINSQCGPDSTEMSVGKCKSVFFEQYGNFLSCELGKFEKYVESREDFSVSKQLICQTSTGKRIAKRWLIATSNTAVASTSASELNIMNSSSSGSCETEQRTSEWIMSNESSRDETKSLNTEILSKHFGNFDSRFAYFLISGKLPSSGFLSKLTNVPWLRVFDYDPNSRETGLLVTIESQIKEKRNFTISTANDPFQTLSEQATDWFFTLGFSDKPDTLSQKQPYQWYCKNKDIMEQQSKEIASFCSCRYLPVFTILWYNICEDDTLCLDWFLSALLPYFAVNPVCKILLCIEETSFEQCGISQLVRKYQLDSAVLKVSLSYICDWLSNATIAKSLPQSSGIRLPKAVNEDDTSGFAEISEELLWIQQYIELLPLRNMADSEGTEQKAIGKDFVKGGTVTWLDLVHRKAIERKDQKMLFDHLVKNLKSDVKQIVSFKIFHSPGGGGTTFARQLLWYLHTEAPCGVVLTHPTFSIASVLERVQLLYEKCQLPILLLVEGVSDYEVQQFYESCKHFVVILHVQRYNYNIPKKRFDPDAQQFYYLPENLTKKEADKLVDLLSEFAPEKKKALMNLAKDVNIEDKFLFEFGLTAFNLEFKGVQNFVDGHLELNHQSYSSVKDLSSWQQVVAYLSLVLYYGQGSLPREVFNHLLNKNPFSGVAFGDLGFSGQKFVVEFNRQWKINYYAVAKEILEQILSITSSGSLFTKGDRLSKAAQPNLHELVIMFIGMLKEAMGKNNSEHILKQLSNVILRRDYKELDDGDTFEKRHYSRLLEDVGSDENRIEILHCLTDAFPFNYEFHAHKGRMLNMMSRFDEAETSLQTALKLRINERLNKRQEWPDNVRGRLHHMFGFACRKRAIYELYESERRQPNLSKVMEIIKTAVKHFNEGRRYAIYNRSYGYIGEVRVRLLLVEFVDKRKSDYPNGCAEAFNGELDRKCIQLSEFIRESHLVCDQLLAECQRYTSDAELKGVKDFSNCVNKFVMCFHKVCVNQKYWEKSSSNVSMRRSRIASLKMMYYSRGSGKVPCVDDMDKEKHVKELIRLHEETFRQAFAHDIHSLSISNDMLEWLEAIRHHKVEDNYNLTKVLHTIESWERRNEVGYASYYLYILYFLLAVYTPGQKMRLSFYFKAEELRKKLKTAKYRQVNTRLTREWLADHDKLTIRKLICRSKLGLWDNTTRFWKDSPAVKCLQVCTGIIVKSSHKQDGIIQLDVPDRNLKERIEVSYYPAFYKLFGNRYSEQSIPVEFFIGFSVERGAEALSVKKLLQTFCTLCGLNTRLITLNQEDGGICNKCKKPVGVNQPAA